MLGIIDAEHAESSPGAQTLVVSQLACSLVAATQTIHLTPGSLAQRLYGQAHVREQFSCNYGLNPAYRETMFGRDLAVAGVDEEGEVRMVELPGHPFFVATLFLPQMRSTPQQPHPLIAAYLACFSS